MTYALFDDAGKFHAGRVMNESDASMQVELDSGKRVKVKVANMLLKFEKPAPAELVSSAQARSQSIELELAWEFAPDAEFGFADLAREYFDAKAGPEQQAAALFRLFDAPHYFRRIGKGLLPFDGDRVRQYLDMQFLLHGADVFNGHFHTHSPLQIF